MHELGLDKHGEKSAAAPLARVWVLWDGLAFANVDGDVSRVDPLLELAHFRVLSTAPEQAWRLHTEVAHWLSSAVYLRKLVRSLLRLPLLLQRQLVLHSMPP
jgi:hypothetical protein